MERGERVLINEARRADIEQSDPETQVFSQVIELVERLGEDEAFSADFGNDRKAMQTVLDGLGVGKIIKPAESIVRMDQMAGQVHPTYGTRTIGKLANLLEELPVTESVRMIQAGEWNTRDSYKLHTPYSSTSRLFYRSSPGSDLVVAVQCSVRYTPKFPEWDSDYAHNLLKSQESYEKMELLGSYLLANSDDDRAFLPEQRFAFSILKTNQLKNIVLTSLFPLPIDIYARRSIANMRYENGSLIPISDEWTEED